MTFRILRAAREYARRHLDCVDTLEDYDLLCEIGYHQEKGAPLTMKELVRLESDSAATLQRRLRRLKERGAILQTRSSEDARIIHFSLSPRVQKAFTRYMELIGIPNAARAPGGEAGE